MEKNIKLKQLKNTDEEFFLKTYNQEDSRKQMELDIIIPEDWFLPLISNSKSLWFIIEEDKTPVGLFNSFEKEGKLYFGIIVSKDKRRQGIARKTLKKYLEFIDKEKVDSYLECFNENPAKALYKELGYKQMREYRTIRDRKYIKMKRRFVNN